MQEIINTKDHFIKNDIINDIIAGKFNVIQEFTGEHYIFGFILLLVSFIITFFIGKLVIPYFRAKKMGQSIRELGPSSHFTKSGTPTMGGVIFIFVFVVLSLVVIPFDSIWLWAIIVQTLGFALIGFIDDYKKLILKSSKGIKARYKIFGQIAISAIVFIMIYLLYENKMYDIFASYDSSMSIDFTIIYPLDSFYVPLIEQSLFKSYVFIFCLYIFISVATSNAVNITDGLDGLAGGISIPILILLAISCIVKTFYIDEHLTVSLHDSYSLFLIILILIGTMLGFLWFNTNPAQIFMGDTGSLALGGVIAIITLILKMEILLLIFGLVYVAEALSVAMQVLYYKYTGGRRIFKMAPLHHHFELSSWKETKIVIVFYCVSIILCFLCLLIYF